MGLVSMDLGVLREALDELDTFTRQARGGWPRVEQAARRAQLSPSRSTLELERNLDTIVRLRGDLRARVDLMELADQAEAGRSLHGSTSGVVTTSMPGGDSIEEVRRLLGAQLATRLTGLDPYSQHVDRSDVEQLDRLAALLRTYSQDALVMQGVLDTLGPRGTLEVPIVLKDLLAAYERDAASAVDDGVWRGSTSTVEHLRVLQDDVVGALGRGLGVYSTSDAFPREYADGLLEAAAGQTGEGWALSQVLSHGRYGGTFLVDLAGGLVALERTRTENHWIEQPGVLDWRLGAGHEPRYDPLATVLEQLARDPQATLAFFAPDGGGPGTTARVEHVVRRSWYTDDGDAAGRALDVAATALHTHGDPRAADAAAVASATVHALAEAGSFGDAGKDSLGHLLAAYVVDINQIANGATDLSASPPNSAVWETDLPPSAVFSATELRKVLREVMTDPAAASTLGEATAALNAARMAAGLDAWATGSDFGAAQAAANQSAALQGFVVHSMTLGLTAEAAEADANVQAFLGAATDIIDLIPTGGAVTSFFVDQAKSAGTDAVTSAWTQHAARVTEARQTVEQTALIDVQMAMVTAMAERGLLPESAMRDNDDRLYPWFTGGAFDADEASRPEVRSAFVAWMTSGDPGERAAALLPDVAAEFAFGADRAT
ncbi:hypothetical protein OMK64_02260 [Cellulomonas fimi]|uniref:DUF6571 family protein n=1 Tax=Cellulomonas fimi TaxID=1708 RepID=UPI00234D0B73|nr:DUF6571 family protein [Cellulomonas fimi]MDC7120354.1 hypothetical protein [Cellulomonas fimi]